MRHRARWKKGKCKGERGFSAQGKSQSRSPKEGTHRATEAQEEKTLDFLLGFYSSSFQISFLYLFYNMLIYSWRVIHIYKLSAKEVF